MTWKCCLLTVVLGLGLLVGSVASGDVATFQQGLNGYAGCEDTSIRAAYSSYRNRNFGGSTELYSGGYVGASDGDRNQFLIRFNDMFGNGANQIPTGAVVNSAELRLYAFEVMNNYNEKLRLYRMFGNWVEGSSDSATEVGASCTNFRMYSATPSGSDYWGSAGTPQLGPLASTDYPSTNGGDYWGSQDPIRVETLSPTTANQWVTWDITGFVLSWQDGSMVNNGVLSRALGQYLRTNCYSSEYATDTSLRPMLVIDYTPVPEPATMVLLAAGGLGVIIRRKR
jgi:hypothetical protein